MQQSKQEDSQWWLGLALSGRNRGYRSASAKPSPFDIEIKSSNVSNSVLTVIHLHVWTYRGKWSQTEELVLLRQIV